MAGEDGAVTDVVRSAVLALADLTPRPGSTGESLAVPTDWFTWLPDGLVLLRGLQTEPIPPALVRRVSPPSVPEVPLFSEREAAEIWAETTPPPSRPTQTPTITGPEIPLRRDLGERLAAVQQMRSGTPFRIGWLWVVGTTEVPDATGATKRRRVLHPLVTRPVRIAAAPGVARPISVVAAGDVDLSPRIPVEIRPTLPPHPETGRGAIDRLDRLEPALLARLTNLRDYAIRLAVAAGFPTTEVVVEHTEPAELSRRDGLRIVVGVALYCVEETDSVTRGNSLRGWASKWLDAGTAFHEIYGEPQGRAAPPTPGRSRLETTMPLTTAQRAAAERARTAPLTVITGAPGTGKSHTIAAAIADALRHGESVLVTTRTEAAVDAMIDLLERQPGPEPVVFGSNERRTQLAARLAGGQLGDCTEVVVESARGSFRAAVADRDERRADVVAGLEAELGRLGRSTTERAARASFPGLFDGRLGAAEVDSALAEIEPALAGGWWRRRRARRQLSALAARAGAHVTTLPGITGGSLREAAAIAEALVAETSIDPSGTAYRELEAAEERVRSSLGTLLDRASRSTELFDRPRRAAVAALATALRAGRETRRVQLERLAADDLIRALPLWIGTLGDVDDLLPPIPALFDLVVIDEASSTEQTLAAPALLRARRAIVAGDPRQLRHVSFVADGTVEAALAAHGLTRTTAATILDVRRNSVFDAAAAMAPASRLDEHHRCDPHLVDVVAERLYPGELTVATRSPLTEAHDCVHVERLDGVRDRAGVVRAVVDRVLTELHALHAAGERSVAVVSPFRAQAAAIEAQVLSTLPTTTVLELDLRVGTAHGMQGNERDVVICSMGVGGADAGARRFAEDPHLLAVLLTRARRRLVLLLSYDPDPGSILAEYVARSDTPPGRPAPAGRLAPWVDDLGRELSRAGVDVAPAYPVGHHVVDLAARRGDTAVAVVAGVHPEGVEAHLDRHLALLRRGWQVIEVPESLWQDRPGETALELAALLRHRSAGPLPAIG